MPIATAAGSLTRSKQSVTLLLVPSIRTNRRRIALEEYCWAALLHVLCPTKPTKNGLP